jgi:serine/threonine protein kinase
MMDEEIARHEIPFYLQLSSHAHIIHTFGIIRDNPRWMTLVQERALHGNLQLLLQNKQFQPSGNVLVNIFSQILGAMIYITKQNIVHGDLRCENILVFKMNSLNVEENLVKLTNRETGISVRYCAPEILQDSNYSELSDVYSMGVLMWEACSKGNIPYGLNMSDEEIRQRRLKYEKLLQPNGCDNQIWTIIQDCWHNEPELRYRFEEMQSLLSNILP